MLGKSETAAVVSIQCNDNGKGKDLYLSSATNWESMTYLCLIAESPASIADRVKSLRVETEIEHDLLNSSDGARTQEMVCSALVRSGVEVWRRCEFALASYQVGGV